jgi:F5/8 type C domain
MYSKYAYGVPDSATNEYDFLVARDAYDAGVQLRNDTTSSSTGKKGVRISHSASNNANVDLRATTGAVNSFAFRLQDDSSPSSFSNMLTLTDDNKSSTSAYGMQVGGRVKASQYYIGESDTRAPTSTGLYLGQDANNKGYFNMNAGSSGTGGFKFSTYDANGQNEVVNLSLDKFGYAKMPKYAATNDALDSEPSAAIVTFNSAGQLVRDYQQNARLRSSESRATNLENTVLPTVSTKVNEIISRMNAVAFFNSNITAMDLGAVPLAYTAPAASVSLNMNVDLTTANSPTFQQNLIQSTADSLNISSSLVSIGSITSATGLRSSGARFKTGSGVNIEIIIAPDPTGTVTINPQVAVQQLAVQAQSPTSPFVAALTQATGSNPVNTEYVPVVKVVPTNTPAPTTPAPTTPAPTTPAPTSAPAQSSNTISTRYIKMKYGTSSGTNRYMSIAGIKVYSSGSSSNLVTSSMTTTASSQSNSSYSSSLIVDSDINSFWHPGEETSPWIQLDLGANTNVYMVVVAVRADPNLYGRQKGMVVECLNSSSQSVFTSGLAYGPSGSTTYSEYQSADQGDGYGYYYYFPAITTGANGTNTEPSPSIDISQGPTTFSPTTLSGLMGWYDASDSSSITLSGSSVTQFNDKSGNNRHLQASNGYTKPTVVSNYLNGKSVLSLNNSQLTTAFNYSGAELDAYIVILPTATGDANTGRALSMCKTGYNDYDNSMSMMVFGSYDSTRNSLAPLRNYQGGARVKQNLATTSEFGIFQLSTNNYGINSALNGSLNQLGTNPTFTALDVNQLTVGNMYNGANHTSGYYAEILLFNRVLSTGERRYVEGYLAWKWGLQSKLPADHPYKLIASPTSTPITARYIKLTYGNTSSTDRVLNLFGIKVYTNEGYNVIKPTTSVSASSIYRSDFPSSNMLDNAEGTFWSSYFENNPWFQVDLGSDMTIYKVEVVNRESHNRENGMVVQCINNANTTVYTSQPVYDKNGATTYSETSVVNTGYRFFACWPSKSTRMYCTNSNPSYALDSNVVTVSNFKGTETAITKYGALSKIWKAPVACKLLSATFYGSGGVNNGGYGSGAMSGPGWYNDIGGHSWPTTAGLMDFYELVNAWNIPTIPAAGEVNFTLNMVGGDRYFSTLQLTDSDLPVIFSYIPVNSIITPAPPTYPPAIVASTYRIKWTNVSYVFKIDTSVTNPGSTNIVTSNPTGDMYTLPAGTYSWSATAVNASNDWIDVTFFDVDANMAVATLVTGVTPWNTKSQTGTFTLSSQKTFQCRYSNGYYAYSTNFDITLTRQ